MIVARPSLEEEMLVRRHDGWAAPEVAVLPARIAHSAVVERAGTLNAGLILGVEESELAPLAIDFTHLLVLGDSESGKTATLRTVCSELLRTTTPGQCQLFVVDPRRSLLGAVESESSRFAGYFVSPGAAAETMPRVTETLRQRMPPSNATPAQLRSRSWWSGPEIYIVVDDADLLGTAGPHPLASLLEFLPHAGDLGLHLVVARRTGGAARAMFEPLFAGLRDAGCVTLLMSGSPDEGLTIGTVRLTPLPPGRGVLIVRRGEPRLIQVGWTPSR